MSDEHDHTDPLAGDNGRDERIAAALAVPPLDELTRRRLVRTAVDAARPAPAASRIRWAFAASVAAAMVGGVIAASVVLSDGGGDVPTAARSAPVETAVPSTTGPRDADTASKTAPAGEAAPKAFSDLPDLGDVTDGSVLAKRVRDAGAHDRAAAATVAPPCVDALAKAGFDTAVPVGRGVQDGTAVLVFRATRAGTPVALTTDTSGSCGVRSAVPLPGP